MNFSENYNLLVDKIKEINSLSIKELEVLLIDLKNAENEYTNLELVVKRNGNSLYGASASKFYSLFDIDIAEDITILGKLFTCCVDVGINNFLKNWGEKELEKIKEFYPEVISLRKFTEYKPDTINDACPYGDTDSRYIDLDLIYKLIGKKLPESDEELANFSVFLFNNFISKVISDSLNYECELRNFRKGFMKMAHEVTTRKTIFRSKKQYILVSIFVNGKILNKPTIKFKGVELKRGSSSPRSKKILLKLMDRFLLEGYDENKLRLECLKLIQYIKLKKEKDFLFLISSVSGLNEIKKITNSNGNSYYTSEKNHIQIQVALSWFNFIEKNNLKGKYKFPFEGQKMNYYYCDENSGYKVIGIPDDVDISKIKNLPEPDYNKMINSVLLKPLLRYIIEKKEIDDIDIQNFLIGLKPLKF